MRMIKANFNFDLANLDGSVCHEMNAGKLLASAFANSNGGDPLQMMDWSDKLMAGQIIELNDYEVEIFVKFIIVTNSFSNLHKRQLLKILLND
jgi:hypothetical protein